METRKEQLAKMVNVLQSTTQKRKPVVYMLQQQYMYYKQRLKDQAEHPLFDSDEQNRLYVEYLVDELNEAKYMWEYVNKQQHDGVKALKWAEGRLNRHWE